MPQSQQLPGGYYDPQWSMQGPPPFDPSIQFDQFGQPVPVDQFGQPYATGSFSPVPPMPQPNPAPQPNPTPQPRPSTPAAQSQPLSQSQSTRQIPQPPSPARQQTQQQKAQPQVQPSPVSQNNQNSQGASMRPEPSTFSDSRLVQRRAGVPFELGIASMTFGVVACMLSWAPVLGQYGLIVGGVGALMGLVGLITAIASKGRGAILSIGGAILCAIAIVVFFQIDPKYQEASKSLDEFMSNMESLSMLSGEKGFEMDANAVESNTSNTSASNSSASNITLPEGQFSNLATGSSATIGSGLTITVDNVETGLTNFDDTPVTRATVTYKNDSDDSQSYNILDWLGQDSNGAQSAPTFYSEAENELGSGALVAGGTVSGNVYFDGTMSKIVFRPAALDASQDISWTV